MPQETFAEKREENISIHIFATSAVMVGACLTVMGILSMCSHLKSVEIVGDELLAFDAILFLASCILSYNAIKTKDRAARLKLEKFADWTFLAGLVVIVVTCVVIAVKLM